MSTRSQTEIKPLPFPVYFWAAVALGIGGLIASVYLAVSHYRVHTDMTYRSFCAISQALNCDTVSQSPFAVFLGLPVAVWGSIGYAGLTLLTALAGLKAAGKKRMWTVVFCVAGAFSFISLALAGISTFKVQSYCIICIATYAINLTLLLLAWIVRRRFKCGPVPAALRADILFLGRQLPISLAIFLAVAAGFFGAYRLIPAYWEFRSPPAVTAMNHGHTEDGAPWIGAANPSVTIVEFSDYQCFQCQKMHLYLRDLMSRHPEAIRLVHRHYPMDHEFNFIVQKPFHVGSGKMALLAIHADARGKFWEMNDCLYRLAGRTGEIDLRQLAAETGLATDELAAALRHPGYRKRLEIDIRLGMKLRVLGTPTFLIDGKLYQGGIPEEILATAIDR